MGPTPTLHYPIWAWGGHEVVLVLPQPRATLCHSDKGVYQWAYRRVR